MYNMYSVRREEDDCSSRRVRPIRRRARRRIVAVLRQILRSCRVAEIFARHVGAMIMSIRIVPHGRLVQRHLGPTERRRRLRRVRVVVDARCLEAGGRRRVTNETGFRVVGRRRSRRERVDAAGPRGQSRRWARRLRLVAKSVRLGQDRTAELVRLDLRGNDGSYGLQLRPNVPRLPLSVPLREADVPSRTSKRTRPQ